MTYSTGELAALAGISVRALRHYDALGLLRPAARTRAGYRRYGAEDAVRLHRILVYRELGFTLGRIRRMLTDPEADGLAQLQEQHALLRAQRARVDDMLRGVEAMLERERSGVRLTPAEVREVFGSFDPGAHAAEAEERWGGTAAYAESQGRTRRYGKAEWQALRAEAERIERGLAEALGRGEAPDSAAVLALAEAHRQHISRWFYDCAPELHRSLGELYVADARFAAHYEQVAPGLAAFVSAAIRANAEQRAGRPS